MFERHPIRRALSAGLLVAAASLPAVAQASPAIDPPATAGAASGEPAASGPGFQWDDAGIGAAAAVMLVGAGGAAASGARRRRVRRARRALAG